MTYIYGTGSDPNKPGMLIEGIRIHCNILMAQSEDLT